MIAITTTNESGGQPFSPSWALVIDRPNGGPESKYRISFYSRRAVEAVRAKLRLLDSDRFETGSFCMDAEVILSPLECEHECPFKPRVKELLGDDPWRGECLVGIREDLLRACTYLRFDITQPEVLAPANSEFGNDWRQSLDCPMVEFHKKRLNRSKLIVSSLFFLITRRSANQRMTAIAERYGLAKRRDDAACDALTNLMFSIYSGGDNSLLNEALEDEV